MKELNKLILSPLGHTWILDLDGTIVKHNGYKLDGYDTFLAGASEFLNNIPKEDKIIIITSRGDDCKKQTLQFLEDNKIKYSDIIFNVPYGERILLNDSKPSGLKTAIALNMGRDNFPNIEINIDKTL